MNNNMLTTSKKINLEPPYITTCNSSNIDSISNDLNKAENISNMMLSNNQSMNINDYSFPEFEDNKRSSTGDANFVISETPVSLSK